MAWDHFNDDWWNPDLDHLQGPKSRQILWKTLTACAQTCRAFSDLALVELWRILNNYVRLLKLLPRTTTEDRWLNTLPVRTFLHPFTDHLLTET